MLKKFLSYTIPSATGMFIVGIYIIFSGIFIGRGIGLLGLAAITSILPFTMLINALSSIFSIGASNTIGYYLGNNQPQKATDTFRIVTYSATIIGIILQVLGLLFINKILSALSTPNLIDSSKSYLFWYLIFILPTVLQGIFNLLLKNEGKQKKSMNIAIVSTFITLVIEYIFIFDMHLGLKSVALSVGIGQSIAFIYEFIYFLKFSKFLTFGKCKFIFKDLIQIIKIGLPTFLLSVSISLIILFTNKFLLKYYGETGIAAYGIINYILSLNYYAFLGIGNGMVPLLSYFAGEKSLSKVKTIYTYSLILNFTLATLLTILLIFFGRELISLYSTSEKVIDLTYQALIITSIGYIGYSLNLIDTMAYQTIHKTSISYLICFMRGIVFILIGLFGLYFLFGKVGIWYSFIFSEFISFIFTFIIFRLIRKSFTLHKIKYS